MARYQSVFHLARVHVDANYGDNAFGSSRATKMLKRIKAYVQVFDEYVASLSEIIEDEEREEGVDDLFLEEDNESEADPHESHDVA